MENEKLIDDLLLSNEEPEEEPEVLDQEDLDQEESESLDDSSPIINNLSLSDSNSYDLTTLESLVLSNNEELHSINENMFRLYYFVGGLYLVFMIVIVFKFFRQFF